MTQFKNLIQDYPSRCLDILKAYLEQASTIDREVTLLLMATAGGFVMPYERLNWGNTITQPNIDRKSYDMAMNKLKFILGQPVKDSVYFKKLLGSWRTAKPEEPVEISQILDAYNKAKKVNTDKKVANVVKIIRHSIAHGNVLSIPDSYDKIQDIIFLSGGRKKDGTLIQSEIVILSPIELESFLFKWFELLKELPVPQHDALDTIDNIAV